MNLQKSKINYMSNVNPLDIEDSKPTKEMLIDMLRNMTASIDKLPPHALYEPVRQYEMHSLILLLVALFDNEQRSSSCPETLLSETSKTRTDP